MIIYVDASVIQTGNGTKRKSIQNYSGGRCKALPGDEVIVAPGLYREAVNPIHAGTADKRITYRSAIKGQAHITGSEAVKRLGKCRRYCMESSHSERNLR